MRSLLALLEWKTHSLVRFFILFYYHAKKKVRCFFLPFSHPSLSSGKAAAPTQGLRQRFASKTATPSPGSIVYIVNGHGPRRHVEDEHKL